MRTPKRLALFNQAPANLHRDIAHAARQQGVPIRQVIGPTGFELPATDVPTVVGCRRDARTSVRRLWTWARFTLTALWTMFRHPRDFGYLTTNPPLVPWLAPLARWLVGYRYAVLLYDLYPDVMVSVGMLREGSLTHRLFRRLNAISLRNAEVIITLGRCMKRTAEQYLDAAHPVPVHVVHNWADADEIKPLPKADNPFAQQHDLVDKFVVMYSGNWSPTHGLDLVVELADTLRDRADLHFVLIGDGGCKAEIVADVARRDLPNLTTLDFQPRDAFRYSITAADCQIVALDEAFYGISVPSKTYSALAAGCAIIAITPAGTELEAIVEEHQCGQRIPARDLQRLRTAVLNYENDRELLAQHRQNARRAVEGPFAATTCSAAHITLLRSYLQP